MKQNKSIEAHHYTKSIKVIVMLIFFSVFLFGTVSAFEFDNIKSYDEETKTIEIRNSILGIPFLQLDKVSEIQLQTPSNFKVGQGYQKVAEFTINNFDDYNNPLKKIEFYNLRDMGLIQRNFDYKYKTTELVDIEDYNRVCNLVTNGTNICSSQISGTHKESKEVWKDLNSSILVKGNITIGIFTDVQKGDVVEWIPTYYGIRINEWAIWSESLNTNLLHYYKLNDTVDSLSTVNLTNNALVNFTKGLIGNNSNGGVINVGSYLSATNSWGIDGGVISMSFWVNNTASPTGRHGIIGTQNDASDVSYISFYDFNGGTPKLVFNRLKNGVVDGFLDHTVTLSVNGSYQHIVVTYDGVGSRMFLDGVLVAGPTNFSGSGSAAITTQSFIQNDVQTPTLFFNGQVDEVGIWDRNLTTEEVTQLFNGGLGITFIGVFVPTITLNSPVDFFNTSNATIEFNGTVTSSIGIDNVTLFIDDVGNETNSSAINDTDYLFTKIISEGVHTWNYESCNAQGCNNGTERTFTIDQSSPTINITFPTEVIDFHEVNTNLFVNWTVSDLLLDTCILEFEGVNTTVTCLDNQTEINITNSVNRSIIFYANDTFGNVNSSSRSWNYLSFQNLLTFNASTFETARETFTVNITTNGTTPTSARLIYNETEFTGATITSLGGNDFNISRTIDIPLISGNNTLFHFNFSIASTEISTADTGQSVNLTTFEFCEVGQQPAYINFTFTNETVAEEAITAEIDTTWNFWLGSGSVIDSLTFSNTTENLNYQFCLTSGGNRTLTANVSLSYDNAGSQLRRVSQEFNLTNITTTQNLFLLPTADGIFVTFQVVNPSEQVISGVAANVTKDGDLISSGITDDAGLITYFLDPDTTYVFSFSKVGFTTVTTTLVPTQTSFTIILGDVTAVVEFDTTIGINYFINPINSTLLNGTLVEFNLTLNATNSNLDNFGFVLRNSTGTLFNETTSTLPAGGFLSVTLDTGSNTDIVMELFWTITGNQTNVTRTWLVFNLENEGFSILTFFNDLSTFLNSGLFGLTTFGLGIIIFMIIILVTGTVSFKFGITDPSAITIIIFSLVFFFDVILNIMINPVNAVNNFPTIFVGVILLGMLIREAVKF